MYSNTLIGFFDILSYSALIRQNSFEGIKQKIEHLFSATASASHTLLSPQSKFSCAIDPKSIV